MYQRNSLTMAQGSAEFAQVGLGLFVPYQMGRAKVIPGDSWDSEFTCFIQGLVNVPIKHHLTIGDIISNSYLKVMFKIPKN